MVNRAICKRLRNWEGRFVDFGEVFGQQAGKTQAKAAPTVGTRRHFDSAQCRLRAVATAALTRDIGFLEGDVV